MKAFKISLCLIMICALLSSVFAPIHLKDLVIVEGVGIDSFEDTCNVSVQMLNTNSIDASNSMSQGNSTITVIEQGDSLSSALTKMQSVISKNMYFGHNKLALFGMSAVKNGDISKLPYIIESMKARADVAVCVCNGKSVDILNSKENDSRVPCENIVRLISNNERAGQSIYVTAIEALDMYENETGELILPVLNFSDTDKVVYCDGIALFNGDRLVKTVKGEDATGILFLLGRVKRIKLEFETGSFGKVCAELSGVKTKNDINISAGDVIFNSDISFKMSILSSEKCPPSMLDSREEEIIRGLTESYVERIVRRSFTECQNASSDCINAGRLLSKCSPSSYELLKDDWDYYFTRIKPSINAAAG